jgi:hypothetical protein
MFLLFSNLELDLSLMKLEKVTYQIVL